MNETALGRQDFSPAEDGNDHSTATAALVSPNFIIDQDETASKADLSSDLILSQRLEELVSEANRFRTKACGMGV